MINFYNFIPILTGIIATTIMTLFTESGFFVLQKPYHVIRTLALLFNYGKQAKAHKRPGVFYFILAIFIHYVIGVLFSFLYSFAITHGFFGLSLTHAILYGMAIGIIGIVGWKIFLAFHNYPLHYSLKIYFSIIWIGHICLALTLFYFYKWFEISKPIVENIPMC